MTRTQEYARRIKQILGLESHPVGVKFSFTDETFGPQVERLSHHRYCQALMLARRGQHVILDAQGIACPAAAAAFGFKPLPDGLRSGKGLQGFGIVREAKTGQSMFEGMTTLEQGALRALYLFPLTTANLKPDIVVVEDEVEKLMWLAMAEINRRGGRRITSSTAVLQATCVDATLIPYQKKEFNMSMGCYGCRDATDIGVNETVLGFPFEDFEEIVQALEFLNQKAIANSRGKNAFALLNLKNAEIVEQTDPFNK